MYEDYIQNLFGRDYRPYQNTYDPMLRNTNCFNQIDGFEQYDYEQNNFYESIPYDTFSNYSARNIVSDLENLYPEIYKIIYPMIQKACNQNTKPIDENLIDDMTDDIYSNIEADNIINLNINIENNRNEKVADKEKNSRCKVTENRQVNNPIRDLIRILLIRELLDRPGYKPPRPRPPRPGFPGDPAPRPPRPPRPGFPGGPPPPPPRPRYY